MKEKKLKITVSESLGQVSAISVAPDGKADYLLVLGHGAGAGMTHPFMAAIANALAERGIATLRYNFPFMEGRKGRPDPPAIAEKTVGRAIEEAQKLFPELKCVAGGKSFGGRMTSQYTAKNPGAPVHGLIFFGFPLHAPGKPGVDRAAHLKEIQMPMLFLQGTRDALADLTLIRRVCKGLKTASLVELEGADHSFRAGKNDLIPMLADAASGWLKKLK